MPEESSVLIRLLVRVLALFPEDWCAKAGARFRQATITVARYAKEHDLTARDILEEGIELGKRKLEGKATAEHAHAVKEYREEEGLRISNELQRRTLEAKVQQEQAKVVEMEATAERVRIQAEMEKLRFVEASIELVKRLRAEGLILKRDADGGLIVGKAPENLDWNSFETQLPLLLGFREPPHGPKS